MSTSNIFIYIILFSFMKSHEEIKGFALRNLFFAPTAEIYKERALKGFIDLLPNGRLSLKKYVEFWRDTICKVTNSIEIDGCDILPKAVFEASGHLETFTDPVVKCKKCNSYFRADKLIKEVVKDIHVSEKTSPEEYKELFTKYNVKCPNCNEPLANGLFYDFNLMLKTAVSVKEKEAYLRPEACQTIYLDFKRVYDKYKKLPLAISQIGKAYRNEISPRKGFVRVRELRQMDIQVFFDPEMEVPEEWIESVKDVKVRIFLNNEIREMSVDEIVNEGLTNKFVAYHAALTQKYLDAIFGHENVRFRVLGEDEKPFYAKFACDVEVFYDLDWEEAIGFHYRTDYDLSRHSKVSKEDLSVNISGKKFFPHVMEISSGVERPWYLMLVKSYSEEEVNGGKRIVLRLPPIFAPYTAVILPLVSNKEEIVKKAREVYEMLKKEFRDSKYINFKYDEKGSIGSRYRESDEQGIPYAITIDFDTLKDDTVTIRNRDTMKQERVKISDLPKILKERVLKYLDIF